MIFLWPEVWRDLTTGRLYLRGPGLGLDRRLGRHERPRWTPIRRVVGPLWVRARGREFHDYAENFEKVAA